MVDKQRRILAAVGVLLLAGSVGFTLGANRPPEEPDGQQQLSLTVAEPVNIEADSFTADVVLLPSEEIYRLNRRAALSDTHIDILNLPPEKAEEILSGCFIWPGAAAAKEDLSPISVEEQVDILENAILSENPGYGLILTRGSLRALPTMTKYVNPARNPGFDRLQLSAIYPQEPVHIFGTSRDGEYLLVASDYYAGWILKEHVAPVGKTELESLLDKGEFLVVQDNQVIATRVNKNGEQEQVPLPMGTVVPLSEGRETAEFEPYLSKGCYHGTTFDAQGELALLEIEKSADVSLSYLPLTEEAVIRQANKLLGETYDWGGAEQGRDCSAMVRDIYSGFGFWIPRDSSPQAAYSKELGGSQSIRYDALLTDEEKLKEIRTLPVGSLLFMPGHVMMVYQHDADRVQVIHDYVEYYQVNGSDLKRVEVMQVGVSDLAILDRNGDTYLSSIYGALSLEKER